METNLGCSEPPRRPTEPKRLDPTGLLPGKLQAAEEPAPTCKTPGCTNRCEGVDYAGRTLYMCAFCEPCRAKIVQAESDAEKAKRENARRLQRLRFIKEMWGGPEADYHNTVLSQIPDQTAAKAALELSLDNGGIMLVGDTGLGKSRTAYLIFKREVLENGIMPAQWNSIKLRNAVSQAARGDDPAAREKLINRILRAPMFFLDDLGDMASTDTSGEMLKEIVEGLTSMNKPIITTTQYTGAKLIGRFRSEETGRAVVRRLGEHCQPVYFK